MTAPPPPPPPTQSHLTKCISKRTGAAATRCFWLVGWFWCMWRSQPSFGYGGAGSRNLIWKNLFWDFVRAVLVDTLLTTQSKVSLFHKSRQIQHFLNRTLNKAAFSNHVFDPDSGESKLIDIHCVNCCIIN